MNPSLWQLIAKSCGIHYLNKTTFLKTEFTGGRTIYQGQIFLGHIVLEIIITNEEKSSITSTFWYQSSKQLSLESTPWQEKIENFRIFTFGHFHSVNLCFKKKKKTITLFLLLSINNFFKLKIRNNALHSTFQTCLEINI